MNVDILFYGIPYGEDFYAVGSKPTDENDKIYCGKFYANIKEQPPVKFVVEIRKTAGKIYCYYNYLVYRNPNAPKGEVLDNANRPGSYFGITLKIEGYLFLEIREMYDMLTDIFNFYVAGQILKKEDKDNLKWAFPTLANAKNKLEEICKELSSKSCRIPNEKFVKILGVGTICYTYKCLHLYSYSNNDILSILKSDDRIALSPFYKSEEMRLAEDKHKQEIEEMNRRMISSKKENDEKIDSLTKEISQLKNYTEKSDRIFNQLESVLANRPRLKDPSQPSTKNHYPTRKRDCNNDSSTSQRSKPSPQPTGNSNKSAKSNIVIGGIIVVLLAIIVSLYNCTGSFRYWI